MLLEHTLSIYQYVIQIYTGTKFDVYLNIFAGLGMFFVGINLLSDCMKSHGKPYVGKIIHRAVATDLLAIINGAIAGAITNSGKAVTFSLTGLVYSGLLSPRKSFPFIVGGSIGSALLVLWVSISFKQVDLMMLGTAGLYYQFGSTKSSKSKFIGGLLLGLGLVFFGLDLLKTGTSTFKQDADFIHFITSTHGYLIIALILGAIAAFVTQSGSTIAIIAISFFNTGLLSFEQIVMFVYGTNIGSGISTALLGLGVSGTSRQLVMFHALLKMAGSIILVPLLYLETYAHIPLVKNLAGFLTSNPGAQIGGIYVMYEFISGTISWALIKPSSRLYAYLWPPSREELLSTLKHINNIDFNDIDGSLNLIDQEQASLLHRSHHFFDSFRKEMLTDEKVNPKMLYETNRYIHKEIERRISECAKLNLSTDQNEFLLHRHSIQVWVTSLNENLYELVKVLTEGNRYHLQKNYTLEIISALDQIMDLVYQSVKSESSVVIRKLIEVTETPDSFMNQFKPKELASDENIDIKSKKILLDMFVCYERFVWVTNKLAHVIASDKKRTKYYRGTASFISPRSELLNSQI